MLDNLLFLLAGGPGFEPGLTESESVVLPLDDPPIVGNLYDCSTDPKTTV